jgi:hypothetical protein
MSKTGAMKKCRGAGNHILLSVIGFSLVLVLMFTLVTNILPQLEGEAPVDEEVNLGEMTAETFAIFGESIFTDKGTCTLCHNDKGRAPDILTLSMVETANERLRDERYQGRAKTAEEYLRESMLDPGAYVVKGYGKKGSNDTVSPMPAVNKAPTLLTDIEIDAVIAFMQAKDGYEITVSLPSTLAQTTLRSILVQHELDEVLARREKLSDVPTLESEPGVEITRVPTPATSVEEVVTKYLCTACHSLMESESPVGPNLDTVGSRLSADEIRQSIVEPEAMIAEGFPGGVMPQDFAEKMIVSELDMLVKFLAERKQ